MKIILLNILLVILAIQLDAPIDSDITIFPYEKNEPNKRSLEIYCQTTKSYINCPYHIQNKITVTGKTIHLAFTKVTSCGVCKEGGCPAEAIISIGELANGIYNFNINTKNILNTGKLIVTDDYYELKFLKEDKIKFKHYRFNRIPKNTIWGVISSKNLDKSSDWIDSFIDSLQILGAKEKYFKQGKYIMGLYGEPGSFEVDSTGRIHNKYKNVRSFQFYYKGDMKKLENMVRNYSIAGGKENIGSITLYGSSGEKYFGDLFYREYRDKQKEKERREKKKQNL